MSLRNGDAQTNHRAYDHAMGAGGTTRSVRREQADILGGSQGPLSQLGRGEVGKAASLVEQGLAKHHRVIMLLVVRRVYQRDAMPARQFAKLIQEIGVIF